MKLTGKCKEDFEKWYWENVYDTMIKWDALTFSMQYGVYVDFFDSVGIDVYVASSPNHKSYYFSVGKLFKWETVTKQMETRHEARTKAIEKANEIYNEKMVS